MAFQTIDEYIAQYPEEVRARLEAVRAAIRSAAPEATEKISWQMPTFYQNGNLIHFAVFARHIGIYPGAEGVEAFIPELKARGLKYSKGAIQLPFGQELPLDLVVRITRYNVEHR